MLVITVVLTEDELQLCHAPHSPCQAHITSLPLAKHRITSKIFTAGGCAAASPAHPAGRRMKSWSV